MLNRILFYNLLHLFYLIGEVLGFETLVYGVFEYIHAMIDTSKFRSTVRKSMDQLLYYVILYMQITQDQVLCGFM